MYVSRVDLGPIGRVAFLSCPFCVRVVCLFCSFPLFSSVRAAVASSPHPPPPPSPPPSPSRVSAFQKFPSHVRPQSYLYSRHVLLLRVFPVLSAHLFPPCPPRVMPSSFRPRARVSSTRFCTFSFCYFCCAIQSADFSFIAFSGSGFKPKLNANAAQLKTEPLVTRLRLATIEDNRVCNMFVRLSLQNSTREGESEYTWPKNCELRRLWRSITMRWFGGSRRDYFYRAL